MKRFTDERLRGFAGDVAYEMDLLCFAAKLCGTDGPSGRHDCIYLEGFLAHARTMLEFLYKRPRRDPNAGNYGSWKPDPQELVWALGHWETISKFLSHLSARRFDPSPDWPVEEIEKGIVDAFDRFKAKVRQELKEAFNVPVNPRVDKRPGSYTTLSDDRIGRMSTTGEPLPPPSIFMADISAMALEPEEPEEIPPPPDQRPKDDDSKP
jgi:hypothetical protein